MAGEQPTSQTSEAVQKVALPAFLPKRMKAFRVGSGTTQSFVVRDTRRGESLDLEPWQFFVLAVLPGCENEEKLAGAFQDRFGYALPRNEATEFFADLADRGMLNDDALQHPVLERFANKRYRVEDGEPRLASFREAVASGSLQPERKSGPAPAKNSAAKAASTAPDEALAAGVQGAIDLDPRATRRMWVWFDPRWLLKIFAPLLAPLRFATYVLPLIVGAAVYLGLTHARLLESDFDRLLGDTTFFQHAAFSLLTTNLAVVATTAVTAYRYRATVHGFGIALAFGFLPRFGLRIRHTQQLSRGERMWLHGAPLLVRLAMFSTALLTWYATRPYDGLIPRAALGLAAVSLIGFTISAIPLIKSSGYHLLAAFCNEPHLRGKAYRTFLNKSRGGSFQEAEELLLAAYAVATVVFMFGMIVAAVLVLGLAFHQIHLGGTGLILMAVVAFVLTRRAVRYFGQVEAAYERQVQFERWRKRVLPKDVNEEPETHKRSALASYLWRAVPLSALALMFLPYGYSPGGSLVIVPGLQQPITTDLSGVIQEVFYEGGETLEKGAVIARLDEVDYQAEVAVLEARIAEQQAVIDDIRGRPHPEDVRLAREALQVQRTKLQFSKSHVNRLKGMYKDGAVSHEEYDNAVGRYEVDLRQEAEKEAALKVAKKGATPEEIAAAEAKLQSLRAQRDSWQTKVDRSKLVMPFDGKLLTLHLKHKGNAYYERGEVFATAERTGLVTAELEIPESDIEYVHVGSKVRAKALAFSKAPFEGEVTQVDWTVTERPFGNVIKVLASIQNPDGKLRNGMSGYAKVEGPEMPVWQAFSLAVTRFLDVQVWSWIP